MSKVAHLPSGRSDISEAEWEARLELAAAYRLSAKMGWSDLISAHISLRVPGHADQFLINPYGEMFDEITASSLIKTDMRGQMLSESPYPINPAVLVIHATILEARPDVNSVVHLHSTEGRAVSMQDRGLLPASPPAPVVWSRLCYHDFEGVAIDDAEKASLVRDLGDKKAMILRNHGTLTVGATMGETFVLMYQLERACRMQVAALAGAVKMYPISEEVIAKSIEQGRQIFGKSGFVPQGQKEWAALRRKLDREDPGYRN
ncbi:MAG TPA: class II aldolase/adducin family protein [Rhodocyclaceae bacterium]|nr:class II aldolase/adducin family protein [Rhodocyclaceae bacterium]